MELKALHPKISAQDWSARFAALESAASTASWLGDAAGNILEPSVSWASLTRQGFEEYRSLGWLDAVHSEDRPEAIQSWKLGCATGQAFHFVYRLWVTEISGYRSFKASVIPLSGTQTGHWLAVHVDVSEHEKREKNLKESEKLSALRADIAAAGSNINDPRAVMQQCVEAFVKHLGVAFARIWTLEENEDVLKLIVSAGMYTHIDGGHARVPVGKFKIGMIAEEKLPHLTNSVIGDPRVPQQQWALENKLVSFAGYPFLFDNQVLGVLGMFSKTQISGYVMKELLTVVDYISLLLVIASMRNGHRLTPTQSRTTESLRGSTSLKLGRLIASLKPDS
jgi:hypothetical protein